MKISGEIDPNYASTWASALTPWHSTGQRAMGKTHHYAAAGESRNLVCSFILEF